MRRCIRCTQWKDESEFNVRNIGRGYLQSVCIECQQQNGKDRYSNNTDRVKEINKTARRKSRDIAKQYIYEYLSRTSCADCGESDIEVLTFDHVRGQKKMNVSDMIHQGYSLSSIQSELEKTDVLCFNCHMRREQSRRGSARFQISI